VKKIHAVAIGVLLVSGLGSWTPFRVPVPPREATPSEITEVFKLLSSRRDVAEMAATHRLYDVRFSFKSGTSSVGYTVEYDWGEKGSSLWAGRNVCQGFFVSSSSLRFHVADEGWGVRQDGRARCNY
jgi:hypothetical protein